MRRQRHTTNVPAAEHLRWDVAQPEDVGRYTLRLPRTPSRAYVWTARADHNQLDVRIAVTHCGCWLTGASPPAAGDWGPCFYSGRIRSHAGLCDA